MQAISGAGHPGVASLDILGNVVPYIGGEEEKIEAEIRLMLGHIEAGERVEAGKLKYAHSRSLSICFSTETSPFQMPRKASSASVARAHQPPLAAYR